MVTILNRWRNWSLSAQFALAGGIVMLCAMLVVGQWVAARIEETVVRNWANTTALYMESFISPLSQDLAAADELSPLAHRALEEVFQSTTLGERVVSYKIWKPGGLIVEASDKALVGARFPESAELRAAWGGRVSGEIADPEDDENRAETELGIPLLEIYSPIREVWSGRIIGVVEFYEKTDALISDLAEARRKSWATVATVFAAIGVILWGIVARGNRTIETQRAEMQRQVTALAELSDHNTALRLRVQGAAARSAALHDQVLRQLGADLHDGPAQLLGYAALRLDGLGVQPGAEERLSEVDRAVKDAIREIRSISRGVSLPDIAQRGVCQIITGLAEAHQARSGAPVAVSCDDRGLPALGVAEKTCIYRFVQEGLNNAWRHAEARGQEVRLSAEADRLVLCVCDDGPGFAGSATNSEGLGLVGLRDRVEALGGTFEIENRPQGGARLRMTLSPAGES